MQQMKMTGRAFLARLVSLSGWLSGSVPETENNIIE